MNDRSIPFHGATRELGPYTLLPLDPPSIELIAAFVVSMDPWKRLGYRYSGFQSYLSRPDPGLARYRIALGQECAGVLCIRYPWLRGPFLELIALRDGFQGRGAGRAVLGWMEREAMGICANLWTTVSSFNQRALAFYMRQGFAEATVFTDFLEKGEDEILLRKVITAIPPLSSKDTPSSKR